MEEVYVNGDIDHRIAGNLNISFNFVEGESLIMALRDLDEVEADIEIAGDSMINITVDIDFFHVIQAI